MATLLQSAVLTRGAAHRSEPAGYRNPQPRIRPTRLQTSKIEDLLVNDLSAYNHSRDLEKKWTEDQRYTSDPMRLGDRVLVSGNSLSPPPP